MQLKTKFKILEKTKIENEFQVIILNYKPKKNAFNGEILGLKLYEWLILACGELDTQVVDITDKANILSVVKGAISRKYSYSIILLSKTPLLEETTIRNIMEYAKAKDISLCKLPAGYVVKNNSLLSEEELNVDSIYTQNMNEFYIVENLVEYKNALEVLESRILDFHIQNGVSILSPKTTYIEPFVDISNGVQIFPHNSLKGKTKISKNTILKENNVIENSKIGANSCLSGSIVEDSLILDEVYISPFSEIKKSIIRENSILGKGVVVHNSEITKNSKIAANEIIGEINDSNSGTR